MNIVYLLTNKNKKSGKRFYIGAKQEASIVEIEGVAKILNKKGVVYNSCSCSTEFANDLKNGDVFEASLIEEIKDKNLLHKREKYYIDLYDVANSEDYYNLSNLCFDIGHQDQIANEFGQTYKKVASDKSSISKRDNAANKYGFDNFGNLVISVYKNYLKTGVYRQTAREFGMPHYMVGRLFKDYDLEKAVKDCEKELYKDVRMLYVKGATLQYIAKILDIELPAARIFLGEYGAKYLRSYITSLNIGMTPEELRSALTKEFIKGRGINDIARGFNIDATSCKRYIYKCIREKLKISDL